LGREFNDRGGRIVTDLEEGIEIVQEQADGTYGGELGGVGVAFAGHIAAIE